MMCVGLKRKVHEMIDLHGDWMEYRKQKGLTQAQAAEYLGISRSALASFEIGRSYPKGTSLLMLIETLYPAVAQGAEGGRLNTTECPGCKTKVPGPKEGAAFCVACGYRLGRKCYVCDVVCRVEAKFCDSCGRELT